MSVLVKGNLIRTFKVSYTRDPSTNLILISICQFGFVLSVNRTLFRTFLCTFHGKTGAPISMKHFFLVQYMHEKVIIGYFELSHEFFLIKQRPLGRGLVVLSYQSTVMGEWTVSYFIFHDLIRLNLHFVLKVMFLFRLKLPNDYLASVCVCFSLCGVGTCFRIGYVNVYQQIIYQLLSSDEFFEAW